MNYCFILSLVAILSLQGVQTAASLVCATPAGRPAAPQETVTGRVHALTIFARFKNEDDGNQAAPDFASQLFDPQRAGSLTHFYQEMSQGQFELRGEALPRWYTSRGPASAYLSTEEEEPGLFGGFSREILAAVDAEVDLGRYDNDGPDGQPNSGDDDGYVDFIFITTRSAPRGFIVGGATGIARLGLSYAYTSDDRTHHGGFIRVRADVGDGQTGGTLQQGHFLALAVGSMAHEFGHVLGLTDLYNVEFAQAAGGGLDPADDSAGIGYWGLMGHGARGWNDQGGPTPFSVWSLGQLGWLGMDNDRLVVVEEDLEGVVFEDVRAGGKVYKVPTQDPQQYFLVVHRRPNTSYYERHLPGAGLLIWRINTWQRYNEIDKAVDLVCADGLYRDGGYGIGLQPEPDFGEDNLDFWAHDAEYSAAHGGNLGDATDLYDGVVYTDFSVVSNPASPAGIAIADIRRQGDRMVADLRLSDRRRAGPIQGDQIWKDTVQVVGDVTIHPGGQLIIAPGTVVQFGEDLRRTGQDPQRSELVVQGELRTGFSGSRPVLFTAATAAPQPGDWYGIRVGAFGQVILRRAVIEYARDGLSGDNLNRPHTLEEVVIRQVSHSGIHFDNMQDDLTLSQVEVRRAGETGVWITGRGTARIWKGVFADNGQSGLVREGGRIDCIDSEFADNGIGREEGGHLILGRSVSGRVVNNRFHRGVGIRCLNSEEVIIEKNQLRDHRIGLTSFNARPWISANEFTNNELALQISGFAVPRHLALNVFQDVTRLLDNQAATEVVARHNWWGQVDEEWIAARISGAVDWEPFLNFDPRLPIGFSLSQSYPNPFNGSTVIEFSVGIDAPIVAGEADLVLEVRTILGGLVRRLVQQPAAPGFYSVRWDGRDEEGRPAASGVYYYYLRVGPLVQTRQLLLLK